MEPKVLDMSAWGNPRDGTGSVVRLPRGARLARIRGSRGQPILLWQERGKST
jgi:hypothetical protein